ncbi:MAG: hypothetical protein P4L27_06820 [Ignavibacteriaceae bacterium]|nr:hypothetical protein [Ignavibacteriaceae bacterium]
MRCSDTKNATHLDCSECEEESTCESSRLMSNWDRLFLIFIIGIDLYVLYRLGLVIF